MKTLRKLLVGGLVSLTAILNLSVRAVPDAYNSVYDDVDLSGNGLVGRVKKALGLNPLDPSYPLTLKQVITGEEPDIITFEVPVSYDTVTNSGTLSLDMNGLDVTLEECIRATNGNCLLSFNADYDPAGLHYLAACFRLRTEPAGGHPVMTARGGIQPFVSGNTVQFFESGSMFDDSGAYLDAKLFVQSADYVIDLYDVSTNTPGTWIMSITNSTDNGWIQEDWGVTNADGTPFAGTTVAAVFNVMPAGTLSGAQAMARPLDASSNNNNPAKGPRKLITRATGSLSEWGPNFDLVYMYTPTNDSLRAAFGNYGGNAGDIWLGMQGVVDVLLSPVTASGGSEYHYNSGFDRCTSQDFPGQPGIPGYTTSRADITNHLLPDMANGLTKQFYCYAHGTNGWLSSWNNDTYLSANDVSQWLTNHYTKTNGLIAQNPYRFVFLDGCSTASGKDWRRAFGICPLDAANQAARNKTGPQAYVGWADVHAGLLNGGTGNPQADFDIAVGYAQTLRGFYSLWMNELSLKTCVDYACFTTASPPFPVPRNKDVTFHANGGYYHQTNVMTSKIYIVGYPGLYLRGTYHNYDTDTTYAAPKNVE
jgi:hypothetical protein